MNSSFNKHTISKSSESNVIDVNTKKRINPYRPRLVEEGLPVSYPSSSKITTSIPLTSPEQTKKSSLSLQSLAKNNNFNRFNGHKTRYSEENPCELSYSTHLVIGANNNNNKKTVCAATTTDLLRTDYVNQNSSNQTYSSIHVSNPTYRSDLSSSAQLTTDINYNDDDQNMNMDIDSFDDNNNNVNNSGNLNYFHSTGEMIVTQTPHTTQTMDGNIMSFYKSDDISQEMNIDHKAPSTLVVLDGANIAYAYADAMGCDDGTVGIDMAVQYFLNYGLHVLAVLPAHWARIKPKLKDLLKENAMMQTTELDILTKLKNNGNLCLCPPADDDDAYIIDIARKADKNFMKQQQKYYHLSNEAAYRIEDQGAYIVSCDMYRDAIKRDRERQNSSSSLGEWMKKKRISFIFYQNDMHKHGNNSTHYDYNGKLKDRGVFIPNPRHELIIRLNEADNDFDKPWRH